MTIDNVKWNTFFKMTKKKLRRAMQKDIEWIREKCNEKGKMCWNKENEKH